MKVIGTSHQMRYKSDDTKVSEEIAKAMNWETGFPTVNANEKCVAIRNQKFVNIRCDGQGE